MTQSVQPVPANDDFPDELPQQHEIVCGRLVRKAVATTEHGVLRGRIFSFLDQWFYGRRTRPGGWWVVEEPEIVFIPDDELVRVPDLATWDMTTVPERPTGTRVRALPQWVCEILSSTTAQHDKGDKLDLYYQYCIDHYWLIDQKEQTLTVLTWTKDGYQTTLTAGRDERVRAEPFAERELDLGRLFDFE